MESTKNFLAAAVHDDIPEVEDLRIHTVAGDRKNKNHRTIQKGVVVVDRLCTNLHIEDLREGPVEHRRLRPLDEYRRQRPWEMEVVGVVDLQMKLVQAFLQLT